MISVLGALIMWLAGFGSVPEITQIAAPIVCPHGTFKFKVLVGGIRTVPIEFRRLDADGKSTDVTAPTDVVLFIEVFLALLPIVWISLKFIPDEAQGDRE